ncbi:UBA domain-containing protein Ucp14 [Plectosphaerella plurivora]|uniref:UBA domain-containing protein Ucp14 n=1 Tax=Plectosphaerella plurivora TaxID=936078 RepID=A0A9P8V2D6_9PEZI|nr:UBA domain-containing protein Ucp14 [Plectosphaerella plurivora]
MSFANAPVTRTLVIGLVILSIAASLLDVKHYFYIRVDTHFWRYRQFWRMFTYQLCCTNSSEALFASITLYNMRILEQMWGSRKYASFLVTTAALTAVIPPVLLTVFLRPITRGLFNYMPAGPTPLIFAILSQYHALIPHIYSYRVATSAAAPSSNEPFSGLTFSDKSYRYALALQLALFQWPGSVLGALVGWVVGHAWRNDLLPAMVTRWRVPGWLVGVRTQRRRDEFEGLRRRLEGENATATSSGAQAQNEGESRQRTVGQDMRDQLRGFL